VLVGAEVGGVEWMIGGFLATLALAFVLYGISSTRQTATVSISSTVLGAGWVGLGLGCILLLRALDHHGRLAALSVLLAVFAADTAALYVGKLIGRHKLAPALSPGKTWEGFVGGAAAAVAVVFFALYRSGFVDGWRSFVLGGVIALSSVMGDLFESALKRDMEVKDSGRLLLGHGGVLDRLDAILFAGAASFYVIRAFGAT
jgi:phosphatidate cytidylyltransferase